MANILLRSPYFIYEPRATALSSKMELFIENVLKYTIIKNTDSAEAALFEIAELAKDYSVNSFNGTYTDNVVSLTITVQFYDAVDGGGSTIGSAINFYHEGFNGYSNYQDGKNAVIPEGSLLITNRTIYQPEGIGGVIPVEDTGQITYVSFNTQQTSGVFGGQTVYIKRLCEPKFTPIKVTFVNKFGALQDMYFFKKTIKNIAIDKDRYKRHAITQSGNYTVSDHQDTVLRANGNERITLNSPFVDEGMNAPIKELLLSTSVWITENSVVLPVVVSTKAYNIKPK